MLKSFPVVQLLPTMALPAIICALLPVIGENLSRSCLYLVISTNFLYLQSCATSAGVQVNFLYSCCCLTLLSLQIACRLFFSLSCPSNSCRQFLRWFSSLRCSASHHCWLLCFSSSIPRWMCCSLSESLSWLRSVQCLAMLFWLLASIWQYCMLWLLHFCRRGPSCAKPRDRASPARCTAASRAIPSVSMPYAATAFVASGRPVAGGRGFSASRLDGMSPRFAGSTPTFPVQLRMLFTNIAGLPGRENPRCLQKSYQQNYSSIQNDKKCLVGGGVWRQYKYSIMYEEYLYKQELLNTFGKDNELVDNVKLQLREKIINKLKNSKPAPPPSTDDALLRKITNSLIAQHMQAKRLFHSLAVFSPEANYSKHHFSEEELRSLLRVQPVGEQSLFEALVLQAMPRGRMVQRRSDTAAQTDDHQSIVSLENRLSEVEFSYKQKMLAGLKSVEDSEARFIKYKNELEKRCREELEQEVSRIRNFEIANIRIEEQERSKLKLRELEEELEANYRAKMEKLREREAEVIQRVTNKMKQVQTYNFQARQRILKEYQIMKSREEQLQRMKEQLLERQRQMMRQ